MASDDSRDVTVMETMAIALIDDVLIMCTWTAAPSDADWNTWIVRESRREHRAVLVWTKGGAPNSGQRARLVESMNKIPGPKPPVAVLSDSPIMRSIMTAFSWILGQSQPLKGFTLTGIDEAVAWLGVRVAPGRVRAVLEGMQASLAGAPVKKVAR